MYMHWIISTFTALFIADSIMWKQSKWITHILLSSVTGTAAWHTAFKNPSHKQCSLSSLMTKKPADSGVLPYLSTASLHTRKSLKFWRQSTLAADFSQMLTSGSVYGTCFPPLMHQQHLCVEHTATESVCFSVHWQDLRTTNNRPVSVYATPSGTTN